MQLTSEVMLVGAFLGVHTKADLPSTLDDLRLKYEERLESVAAPAGAPGVSSSGKRRRHRRTPRHSKAEVKQAAQWSKMKWHAALGGSITLRLPGGKLKLPDGSIVDESEYNSRGR